MPKSGKRTGLNLEKYSEEEKKRIFQYARRSLNTPVKITSAKGKTGNVKIKFLEDDPLLKLTKLAEAMGTADPDLQDLLLNQMVNVFSGLNRSDGINYEAVDRCYNIALAILHGIQPRDEIEALLSVQMIGVHNLAMEAMRRAMITNQTFIGVEANVNHAIKLTRTFAAQVDALKRYRTGGQQKVTVEHVYVGEGGQAAIVGQVNMGGRGNLKNGQ
jgi:hypothetical protein